jgi:DNA gyrase subunit A
MTTGKDEIILTTAQGQAIRFKESQARPMGRGAAGVRSIKLRGSDKVVNMSVIRKETEKPELLIMTENGYGKRTAISSYKIQSRGGSGIKTAKLTPKTGKLISAHVIKKADADECDLIVSSDRGQVIRTPLNSVSVLGRATQGVRIMRLKSGEKLAATTIL